MTDDGHAPPPHEDGLEKAFCRRYEGDRWRDFTDTVSPEVHVRLRWPGKEPVQLWAYPENLRELAIGHALVELCHEDDIPVLEDVESTTFHLAPQPAPAAPIPVPIQPMSADAVIKGMEAFMAHGGRWDATGCFHRAAFMEPYSGQFLKFAEDIGRHNCLDRLAGWAMNEGVSPASGVVFISARVTASLASKLAGAGFQAVISRSAVTTAGVDIARHRNITLAGFARPGRFSVFTDRENRIIDPGASKTADPDPEDA